MVFEFNNQLMPQNLVEIETIGEFALEATNGEGYNWYIVVKTQLGVTTIGTAGPIVPDLDLLPAGYTLKLDKMQYNQEKLIKTINFWLNDKSKKITEAKIIDSNTALDNFRDLGSYLLNYSEDRY